MAKKKRSRTHSPPPSKPSFSSEPPPPSNSNMPTAASDAAAHSLIPPRRSLFSENDEILIFKALLDFKSKTGNNTITHYTPFYNSLKDSLSVKPTQNQFRKRIWKLKEKFQNKKKKEGNFPTFSSLHEEQVFELSMEFWGSENEAGEKEIPPKKENAAKKLMPENETVKGESNDKMGSFCLREMLGFDKMCTGVNVSKRGMKLIGESERVQLKRRLEKLKRKERKLSKKRFELVEDSRDWILEALQGSS